MSDARCIICKKILINAIDGKDITINNMSETVSDGLTAEIRGNYGSAIFDSMMSEHKLIFFICDDCVLHNKELIFVKSTFESVHVKYKKFKLE